VPHDVRDQIVDFVRRWWEATEIGVGRFIEWLAIRGSKFYDWRDRYGQVNEHNGWVRLSVRARHGWPANSASVPLPLRARSLRLWFRLSEFVNARAKSPTTSETSSTFPAYIVNGRGKRRVDNSTRRRVDRKADIVVGGLQGDRS